MLEVADEGSEGDFARHLQRRSIVIRDLGALPGCGPGFYRLGIRAPKITPGFSRQRPIIEAVAAGINRITRGTLLTFMNGAG